MSNSYQMCYAKPMGYFDDEQNVAQYIKMATGHDGSYLITILTNYLAAGSSLLELGMGPGTDLKLLERHYQVTGSDNSRTFIDRYRSRHPNADLLLLDARTIATERTFDGIYSNKVLHHLSKSELALSLRRQHAVLPPNGILLHSLWRGEGYEEVGNEVYQFYLEDEIQVVAEEWFTILDIAPYQEIEEQDSLYCVLRKRAVQ